MGIPAKIIEEITDYNANADVTAPDDWIQRINYIVEANSTYCNGSFTLYVKTAQIAGLRLFVTLVDFSESDVVRWIFRPKGLGLRGGHKKHGPLRRVQKALNLREINARKVTAGVQTVWRIDNFFQALLFWWMVVDAGTLFLYEWSSLLEESGQCAKNHGLADAPIQTLATVGAFQGGKWSDVIDDGGLIVMGPGGAACGGLHAQIVLTLECDYFTGPGPTEVTLRITVGTPGGSENIDTQFTVPVNAKGSGILSINRANCSSASASVRTVGPGVKVTSGTFHIVGYDEWNK